MSSSSVNTDLPPLYLVDGSALAYRSYFAFIRNPLITSQGQLVSAVYGFMNFLLRQMLSRHPEYLVVVMDAKEKTFRHEKFPAYKATREKMPPELADQLPVIDSLLESLRIPMLRISGYEADDVIGTLALKAEQEGHPVYIFTGDKDFAQLVDEYTRIISPRDEQEWDRQFVIEKWGVPPERIVHLLALAGDSSDNVPGVPRVGLKTAQRLLQDFSTLEELYENLDRVKNPRLRETLAQHKEQAFLSLELVKIKRDVPLEFDWRQAQRREFPVEEAVQRFQTLEFFSLVKLLNKLTGGAVQGGESTTATTATKDYRCLTKVDEVQELVETLLQQSLVAIDLETTSLNVLDAEIVGLSFAWEPHKAVYIPLRAPDSIGNGKGVAQAEELLRTLSPFWSSPVKKTGQNLKFDLAVLARYDISVENVAFDTMLAAYLLNPGARSYKLAELSRHWLQYEVQPIEELIGKKGKKQGRMDEVPLDKITFYAAEDADIAFQLTDILQRELKKHELLEVLEKIELPLIPVLMTMERNGVYVDISYLNELSQRLGQEMHAIEEKIFSLVGEQFNLNSTKQLAHILFDKLGIKPIRKTKTGYSTDVKVLEVLAKEHEVPRYLLEYRQLMKLKSTYTDALPQLVHPRTGRIHSSFNQTITATGRISSTDPNFQNIPIRTEKGREIRRAFRAQEPGWVILSADYSQVELRIMAHFSEDKDMAAAFSAGVDIHAATAARVFHVPLEEVTPDQRRKAKVVNFGIMYGAGPYRLTQELGISREESLELINEYFNSYPGIRRYIDETLAFARENKYVKTLFGRKRLVPDIDAANRITREGAERIAVNMPIQGTAADLIKIAMIRIHQRLSEDGFRGRMILQVHDELVFETPADEAETLGEMVRQEMSGVVQLRVPLVVDVGVGKNWLEAHS